MHKASRSSVLLLDLIPLDRVTFLSSNSTQIERSKRLKPDLKNKNEHEVTARIESVDKETHSVQLLGIQVFFSPETRNKSLLLD